MFFLWWHSSTNKLLHLNLHSSSTNLWSLKSLSWFFRFSYLVYTYVAITKFFFDCTLRINYDNKVVSSSLDISTIFASIRISFPLLTYSIDLPGSLFDIIFLSMVASSSILSLSVIH
jgi:hypothetical protein